jgi:hypothetical protein
MRAFFGARSPMPPAYPGYTEKACPAQRAMLPQPNHSLIAIVSGRLFARSVFQGNAQRAQETDVLLGKWRSALRAVAGSALFGRLLYHFVQTDGRLQHQQNIESMLANILDNSRDLRRFGDRFVNSFPKLLDQAL